MDQLKIVALWASVTLDFYTLMQKIPLHQLSFWPLIVDIFKNQIPTSNWIITEPF